jgi:hypothetical protein
MSLMSRGTTTFEMGLGYWDGEWYWEDMGLYADDADEVRDVRDMG